MGVTRRLEAQSLLQGDVLGRVDEMLLSAEHAIDLHQGVVHHAGEVIRRPAVALADDEVLEFRPRQAHLAEDLIDHHQILGRHDEAHRHRSSGVAGGPGLLRRGQRVGPREFEGPLLAPGLLAHGLQLLRRFQPVVGLPGLEKLVAIPPVDVQPLALEIGSAITAGFGALVPLQAQPAKVLQDLGRRILHVPALVGVFDAQHEPPACPPDQQPVEQRRAGTTDVQIPGGRRCKSNT